MIAAQMPEQARQRRSPGRYLPPLALIAIIAGIYLIVHHAVVTHHGRSRTGQQTATTVQTGSTGSTGTSTGATHGHPSAATFYTVRPGDSLDAISARTGVSVSTLEALNPGVSPNALRVGQRLKLRR